MESAKYTVSDEQGGSATNVVGVTVTPVNDAPVAHGQGVTTSANTPVELTTLPTGTLLLADSFWTFVLSPTVLKNAFP